MRSEAEVRTQLDETRNAMKQFQDQLSAAANQEWALMYALGEVDTPQPEPPQLGQADPPDDLDTGYSDLSNPATPGYGAEPQPLELD